MKGLSQFIDYMTVPIFLLLLLSFIRHPSTRIPVCILMVLLALFCFRKTIGKKIILRRAEKMTKAGPEPIFELLANWKSVPAVGIAYFVSGNRFVLFTAVLLELICRDLVRYDSEGTLYHCPPDDKRAASVPDYARLLLTILKERCRHSPSRQEGFIKTSGNELGRFLNYDFFQGGSMDELLKSIVSHVPRDDHLKNDILTLAASVGSLAGSVDHSYEYMFNSARKGILEPMSLILFMREHRSPVMSSDKFLAILDNNLKKGYDAYQIIKNNAKANN